jgi:hypothetical protein
MRSSPSRHQHDAASAQEQERLFFETLGRTIGQWQLVEMQLFRVYAHLIQSRDTSVASAGFHSINGFKIRLDVVDAAAQVALARQPSLARWTTLYNQTIKRSKRRNLLVHYVVIYDVSLPPSRRGPALQPSIFDVTRDTLTGSARLDISRIRIIGAGFTRLSDALREFADTLPVLASSP